MPIDLDHELQLLGRLVLDEIEPMTADEVMHRRNAPVVQLLGDTPYPENPQRQAPHRWPLVGAAAAVAALVVGLVVARDGTAPGSSSGPDTTSAQVGATLVPSTSTQPSADLVWPPRVLLDETWRVTGAAEQFPSDVSGYIGFERDGAEVSVEWNQSGIVPSPPPTNAGGTVAPPDTVASRVSTAVMLGRTVDVIDLGARVTVEQPDGVGRSHWATLVDGDRVVTASATGLDLDEFVNALASMRQVDAAEWEAALPDELITASERPATVDEMLAGVPVPDGLDLREYRERPIVSDTRFIGAELGEQVACAWLNSYLDATDADDAATAGEATEALADIVKWGLFDGAIDSGLQVAWDLPVVDRDDGSISLDGQALTRDVAAEFCEIGWG